MREESGPHPSGGPLPQKPCVGPVHCCFVQGMTDAGGPGRKRHPAAALTVSSPALCLAAALVLSLRCALILQRVSCLPSPVALCGGCPGDTQTFQL